MKNFISFALFFFILTCGLASYSQDFIIDNAGDASDINPGDGVCSSSPLAVICSLRAAIEEANALAGPNIISFGLSAGTQITIDSELIITDDETTVNGDLNGNGKPDITVVGGNAGMTAAIIVNSKDTKINGLNIIDIPAGAGISIDGVAATNNEITSCFIGTNLAGLAASAFPNSYGIIIRNGANSNFIGNGTIAGRNVIGNNTFGINISDSEDNIIAGNIIGMDANALIDIGNTSAGIDLLFANRTIIGGLTPAEMNLISGNDVGGIMASASDDIKILGNYVGVDITGNSSVGNGDGIRLRGDSRRAIIGDGTAGGRNVISGNLFQGIELGPAHDNLVKGNYIGVGNGGITDVGNGREGVYIYASSTGNVIGGDRTAGEGNIISYNNFQGVKIGNLSGAESNNSILGNNIGLDASGTSATPNTSYGIWFTAGATNNSIGDGTSGGRNVISGNGSHGIQLSDGPNTVQSNYIGLGTDGDQLLGNSGIGVFVTAGANSIIGGNVAGQGNVISGNAAAIQIGAGAHFIYGNTIGLDATRASVRANNEGIRLTGTAKGVLIGDVTVAGANFISGNTTDGIYIDGANVNTNTIQNNYIGVLGDLSTAAGNGANGIAISGDANLNAINNNVISNSGTNGIEVNGASASLTMNNTFSQNSIYNNTDKGISIVSGAQGNVVPPDITNVAPDGTVSGTSGLFASIEIFFDGADQGAYFYGSTTADDAGLWSFTGSLAGVPAGLTNATAIQLDLGNSSAFSNPFAAPGAPPMSFTHTPVANANNIPVSSDITLDFDADINLLTVHNSTTNANEVYDDNISVIGNQSGQLEGIYSLGGDNSILIFNPSIDFRAGEKITVIVTPSVLGTGGEVAIAKSFSFIAASGPFEGAFLEKPSGILGMADGSFDWGDYDNDGDLDLIMTGWDPSFNTQATIYNNDNGTFTDIGAPLTGVFFSSAEWGDYDNDGDLDVVVAGSNDAGTLRLTTIYRNNAGVFTDIGAGLQGVDYSAVDWGDYDNDGDLDLVVMGRYAVGPDLVSSTIYQNNGGVFTDISAGLQPLNNGSADWGDYDADGDLDLIMTGFDAGWSNRYTILYDNNDGVFTDHLAGFPATAWGDADWGDYDNDGDLDLLLSGDGTILTYSNIYNNSGGVFTDIGAGFPTTSEGSAKWGDYDGDGDLDLVLTGNDYSTGTEITNIFNNSGGGVFNDINAQLKTVYFTGLADWGDFDGDGDLDLLVAGESTSTPSSTSAILYENTVPPFITTWQTTDTQITIPTFGAGYDYTVAWTNLTNAGTGDGISGATGNYTITGLANNDIYQIVIYGNFPQIYFANGGDKDKILSVEQWGGNTWTGMSQAFYGCTNLTVPAVDAPNLSAATSLFYMFRGATSFNEPINHWDVSTITNFGHMFRDATTFNQSLSNWDLVSVNSTDNMFDGATSFNQDIGSWNLSGATSTSSMFFNATSFNQDISGWDVGLVGDFDSMFAGATTFNQDIGNWDVSSGWMFWSMFENATSFDQNLGSWDVSLADYLDDMLNNTALSVANYDATLIGWESLPTLISSINLGAVGLFYCTGDAARTSLESTHGWTITDAGLLCPSVPPHMYWTENIGTGVVEDEIHRTDLDGNNFEQFYSGFSDEISGLVMDTANNRLYWTDAAQAEIIYGEIGPTGLSSGPTKLLDYNPSGANAMVDLALDLVNGHIYFTHSNAETGFVNKIARVNIDGTNDIELIDTGGEQPFGIDLDLTNNKIYYTTNLTASDQDSRVYRANLDGSNIEELFYLSTPITAAVFMRDVKIDPVNEIVYWSGGEEDLPGGNIFYNSINEAAPFAAPVSFTFPGEPRGIDIDLFNNKLYWVCRGANDGNTPPMIMRADLDGANIENIFTVTMFPAGFPPGPPGSAFIALDLRGLTGCPSSPTANAGGDEIWCSDDVRNVSG